MPALCAALALALQCIVAPHSGGADGGEVVWPRGLEDPSAQPPRHRDAWIGEDKVRHFAASYAVVAFGYGGARAAGVDRDAALIASVAASAAAGIAKEFYDRSTYGLFSYRDLVWDAAGIIAGGLLVRQVR